MSTLTLGVACSYLAQVEEEAGSLTRLPQVIQALHAAWGETFDLSGGVQLTFQRRSEWNCCLWLLSKFISPCTAVPLISTFHLVPYFRE